jgi:NADH-quinone oxidoreductase subunit M
MNPLIHSNISLAWLLELAVALPFAAGLTLLFAPQSFAKRWADFLGLASTLFALAAAVILGLNFHPSANGYAFLSTTNLGLEGIGARLQLGLNALSLPMFFITALIGCAAGFYTYGRSTEDDHRKGLFWSFLLMILAGALGAFASVDLFYAFLFHEIALLPTFFALMLFGGVNRKQTMIEMGIFVIAGSLLTLAGIINFAALAGAGTFSLIELREHFSRGGLPASAQFFSWNLVFWGCAILSGLWPFYGWVTRLLTQLPTAAAMLIGGSLKFFGLYFLLQAFAGPCLQGLGGLRNATALLCVANIFLLGFSALAQTDFKKLVAYAAVMHMGALFLALNAYTVESFGGMAILIVGGGLATALLLMLGGCLKRRLGSAEMVHVGGLRQSAPRLAAFLMLGVMAVVALPCFVNFWGEFLIILGTFRSTPLATPAILAGLVITAVFGLRALHAMLMGNPKPEAIADLTAVEKFSAWLLILPVILLAIFPNIISGPLNTLLHSIISFNL